MALSSLKNKSYDENSSNGIASALPPCCTSYVVPFLDGDGINIGRFKRRCPAHRGSGDSESNQELVLECKRETIFSKERARLKEKHIKKMEDADTTRRLAPPGAERKNEPYNKNLVSSTSPSQISLASKGPNPAESMLKPNNNTQPSLKHMGCIDCDSYFTIVPMADQPDPKCPICRKNGVSLRTFLTYRENKRARKN